MAEALVLSDGTRTYDFFGDTAEIFVRDEGFTPPVVTTDNTYAEGSDSEGRTRIRSRAQNSEAGSFTVYIHATTNALFRDAVDNLQELVESAHRNKGTLTYTPPNSVAVIYDLEAISITDFPQHGVKLKQRSGEATVTFETKPYGRLAAERLNIQDTYQEQVTALTPSIFLPLGATAGLTDLSGNARNGTAAGSVTVGGATGPLTVDDTGATDFDGTDDRITTTYSTRRNLWINPGFEVDTTGVAGYNATIVRSSGQYYWGGYSCRLTATAAGAQINATAAAGVAAIPGTVYALSYYLYTTVSGREGRADLVFFDAGGVQIGASYNGTAATSSAGTWTRYSVTATAPALTAYVGFNLRSDAGYTGAAAEVAYIDAILIEASSSVGTYFPSDTQLASGEAGWTGTANVSPSDIGCFSCGTSRAFMGWANRDTLSGTKTLVGSSGGNVALRLDSATYDVTFFPYTAAAGTTWSNAWPGDGQWVHWALTFNETTNAVSLYINGVLKSSTTNAQQYPPGTGNFEIASRTAEYMNGKMAWVSVHQSALTATQIRDAYDAGLARITLDGPIDSFVVESIPGQVPALPALTLDDISTQSRNHVEIGVQNDYDSGDPENLLLSLDSGLTALGGASNTRSGSHATNITRAALASTEIAVCKAAAQTHKGLWKIRTRVYCSTAYVRVRLAWRTGDGPFSREKWVTVPVAAGWADLDLGTVNIPELPTGHTCEFRIEAKSTSGSPTIDVDIVECIPADSYLRLRGSTQVEVGSGAIVAMDDFSTQTAGAVTGKTPLLAPAGLYAAVGDADDFSVDTTNQWIQRTAVSDTTISNGRYLRCGSSNLILTQATVDLSYSNLPIPARYGLMLRHDGTTANCLFAVIEQLSGTKGRLKLIKRVASVETELASYTDYVLAGVWYTLNAAVDAAGNAYAQLGLRGTPPTIGCGVYADSSLATAGALATGGYGIYDAQTSATACTRLYDNFQVSTLATSASIINPAINSLYGVDVTHETALTDNSTGASRGVTPIREGNYPSLLPATRNSVKSRIVVKARRDDVDNGAADSGIADQLRAQLTVTPRVHVTGE